MKVAIVHDWLVNYGGAERVVEAMLSLYPDAEIFTLVYDEKKMGKIFPKEKVHTSFLQKVPFSLKMYTKMLSFMPKAFESFDFTGFDLVLCSSSCCAKGVITPPSVPHIAYIHSPMRYAWDLYFDYKKRSGKITSFFMDKMIPQIRLWDVISSQRIDKIIVNSNFIRRRTKKYWNRESEVIYPPVNTENLTPNNLPPENFYVAFSRFVPYKRLDLAIKACGQLKRNLIVIGSGSQEKELKALAESYTNIHSKETMEQSAKITFTGRISDEKVKDYLQRAKALIFCAEEDFGIIPVEAQACGRPVIALKKGGAMETVLDGKTGVFFESQTETSLKNAILDFEEKEKNGLFDSKFISSHAKKFSTENFIENLKSAINRTLQEIN